MSQNCYRVARIHPLILNILRHIRTSQNHACKEVNMPIYEFSHESITPLTQTKFAAEGMKERNDLERLLRDRINVVAEDVMILAEEFGQWKDSRRRIDLLGLDKEANLVVFELKRTEDGGHMDLQALRYASMVSAMTFDQAVKAHAQYLEDRDIDADARQIILEFLDWDEPDEDLFAQDVRIVLVSAEFSKELTTSVIWLSQRELDIRCVRLKPYSLDGRVFVDVQQIMPLPEAADYIIQVREKAQKQRKERHDNKDRTKFDVTIDGQLHPRLSKRQSIFRIVKQLCDTGVLPDEISYLLPKSSTQLWREVPGAANTKAFITEAKMAAENGGPAFEERRWFVDDDELIQTKGNTYALTKMWGKGTAEAMSVLTTKYPDRKIKYHAVDDGE